MFYLPQAILTWLLARWIIDRSRLAHLLTYGLFGAVLATAHDRLVMIYRLWEYRDIGPVDSHPEIALLISLSAAPVLTMRFAQGLQPRGSFPIRRAIRYTLFSMLPEVLALRTGHIFYDHFWNLGWSVVAYGPIWLSIWGLHRWLTASEPTAESNLPAEL